MQRNKRRKVSIRENSWLARLAAKKLGFDYVAMVFGRTIHLHNTTLEQFFARKSWVVHELKHVAQYEEHGLLPFLWKYGIDYLKNGYYNNRFEIEARAAEVDFSLLEQYDLDRYRLK